MKNTLSIALSLIALAALIGIYFFQAEQNNTYNNTQTNATETTGTVYERNYSPSFGPDSAKVTIVEFFDPACEACRAFYPFVKQILERHPQDVRLVLRYVPFHKGADQVIRLLEASRAQGKFNEVLEALMVQQPKWAVNHSADLYLAMDVAKEVGLDIDAAKVYMEQDKVSAVLQQELADIATLKISQTPTFFVNDQPLPSFGGQQLYDMVVAELNN